MQSQKAVDKTGFLDGWRGLAALEVVLTHLGRLALTDPQQRHSYYLGNAWSHAWLSLASIPLRFGPASVWFFFVLSGFVIHLRYARCLAQDLATPFGWFHFFWRRFRRLYPPLVTALVVTWILCAGAEHLRLPVFDWNLMRWDTTLSPIQLNLTTFLGNLLFLMTCYVPTFGTDAALWSLNREWWFYMLYPALIPLLKGRRTPWLASAGVGILFILSYLCHSYVLSLFRNIFHDMLLWWFGALLAEVYVGRIPATMRQLAPLALLLPIAVVLSIFGPARLAQLSTIGEIIFGLGFVGLIAAGFFVQDTYGWSPAANLKWLGEMSYTLYVIHMPILTFAYAELQHQLGADDTTVRIAAAPLLLVLVLLVAYFLHLAVERPFLASSRKVPALRKR